MKTTIALLSVLLIGVSVGFYLDHTKLTAQVTKVQASAVKQSNTIKTLLSCANLTEKTYQQTKKYASVVSCIKVRLSVK
ncbi:TPA: hypothetical protein DEP94_02275 [Candidatus Nomurabacteria bacterium]|nr:hypothetical protein [Candidatus Nomurabacteria bacterium]